jgi:conjugal transfer mating pair stabilization protein TraN
MIMRALVSVIMAAWSLSALGQSLSDAFNQGAEFGRSGNAAARGKVTDGTAPSKVPGYTASPPQASYFGGPGLGSPAGAQIGACAGSSDPACKAVEFSQQNPSQRPSYTIAPDDPLLTRARTITADPQAIAGSIAGTYSGCTVQTVTKPAIFETLMCHQYRTTEEATCDKVLIVTPVQTPGCSPGQLLTRVTADPCPACIDYLAFDFTCGANHYVMRAFTIAKATGAVYMELGTLNVPGTLGTQIPMTPGPSQIDGFFCYQTHYSQSCAGANCTIGAWFANPCQGTSYFGATTFAMPTTVSFVDSWDNQCATLEARSQ